MVNAWKAITPRIGEEGVSNPAQRGITERMYLSATEPLALIGLGTSSHTGYTYYATYIRMAHNKFALIGRCVHCSQPATKARIPRPTLLSITVVQ